MGHTISKVYNDTVGPVVKTVGKVAEKGLEKAASLATHAVVDVGGVAEHLVRHIPGVGPTVANGLAGVTNLAQLGNKVFDKEVHVATHPIDAIKQAVKIVQDPKKLIAAVHAGAITASQAAGDVAKIASAVAVVQPELAPEAMELGKFANKIHQGASAVSGVTGKLMPGSVAHSVQAIAKAAVKKVAQKKYGKNVKVKKAKLRAAGAFTLCEDGDCGSGAVMPEALIPVPPINPFDGVLGYLQALHPGEEMTFHLFRGGSYLGSYSV